jgi:hypothetical protein
MRGAGRPRPEPQGGSCAGRRLVRRCGGRRGARGRVRHADRRGELPANVVRTLPGRLHDAGTLLILGGLLVAAAASLPLIRTRRYGLTVAALAVALLAIVPVLVALGIDAPGLGQRAFVLVGCAFQCAFAMQLPVGEVR